MRSIDPTERDRGQTPQDFAVGISIFLITVMFVFAFVPSVLQPSRAGEEVTLTAEGDRVASALVANLSHPGRPNHLDASAVNATVNTYEGNVEQFRSEYGLGKFTNVNVTIRTLDGIGQVNDSTGDPYRFGDEYRDQQVVEVRRVVTMDDPHQQCQEGCLLIVRIW
jgi:hypothetical protein